MKTGKRKGTPPEAGARLRCLSDCVHATDRAEDGFGLCALKEAHWLQSEPGEGRADCTGYERDENFL